MGSCGPDYAMRLLVDIDPSSATNFVVLNLFNNWPDNAYWNGAVRNGVGLCRGRQATTA